MALRLLAPGTYGFDSLSIGDCIQTGTAEISEDLIERFAALTGDTFEIHMSDAAAIRHGFSARVAHGLLVLSLVDGLKNRCAAQINGLASLGWNWTFRRPILVNDQISALMTIQEKRLTANSDRGIVKIGFEVSNQSGALVQRGENLLMVYRGQGGLPSV